MAQAALASDEPERAAGFFREALGTTLEASGRPNAPTACKGSRRWPGRKRNHTAPSGCSGPLRRCLRARASPATPRWTVSWTPAWRTPPASASANGRGTRRGTRDARCPSTRRLPTPSKARTSPPRSSGTALEHLQGGAVGVRRAVVVHGHGRHVGPAPYRYREGWVVGVHHRHSRHAGRHGCPREAVVRDDEVHVPELP